MTLLLLLMMMMLMMMVKVLVGKCSEYWSELSPSGRPVPTLLLLIQLLVNITWWWWGWGWWWWGWWGWWGGWGRGSIPVKITSVLILWMFNWKCSNEQWDIRDNRRPPSDVSLWITALTCKGLEQKPSGWGDGMKLWLWSSWRCGKWWWWAFLGEWSYWGSHEYPMWHRSETHG